MGDVFSRYRDPGDMRSFDLLPETTVDCTPRLGTVLFDEASQPRRLREFQPLKGVLPAVRGWTIANAVLSNAFIIHREGALYIDASIHSDSGRGEREAQVVEVFRAALPDGAASVDDSYAGESALVLHNEGGGTWGHFLLQNVPKAALYLRARPGGKIALPADQCRAGESPFADALILAGAAPENLLPLHGGLHYKFAELVLIDPVYEFSRCIPHPFALETLAGMKSSSGDRTRTPLFVDRTGAPPERAIANREALNAPLARLGIPAVTTGALGLGEQIDLWRASPLTIGTLGSDFTNLVFAPPNAAVLALSPDWFADAFFYHLAIMKGVKWNELRCGMIAERAEIEHRSSFMVDRERFSTLLDSLVLDMS